MKRSTFLVKSDELAVSVPAMPYKKGAQLYYKHNRDWIKAMPTSVLYTDVIAGKLPAGYNVDLLVK